MGKNNKRKRETNNESTASSSSATNNNSSNSEVLSNNSTENNSSTIPGFYYDTERRRYFRIIPDRLGAGSANCVTPQSMKQRNREEERRKLLNEPIITKKSPYNFDKISSENYSMTSILAKREMGLIDRRQIYRRVAETRVRFDGGTSVLLKSDYDRSSFEQMSLLDAASDGRHILGVGSTTGFGEGLFRATVDPEMTGANEASYGLKVKIFQTQLSVSGSSISEIHSASLDGRDCLFCMWNYRTAQEGVSSAVRVDTCQGFQFPVVEFGVTASSSAWNSVRKMISVGLEDRVELIRFYFRDRIKRKRKIIRNGVVLVQRFSEDGNLLFMGKRGGDLACYDMNSLETIFSLEQPTVTSLHPMAQDGNYIVAGDYLGGIKLWDLRMRKTVLTFDGHVNSNTRKLPFIVNEEDSLIIAGGEDGTTRCWSLQTGELLRQIASPYPVVSAEDVPGVCYSNRWGGVQGNAAIVLGVRDEFHFHELKF